jgi:threonine/homoserine/homoserine lactone efflux protein
MILLIKGFVLGFSIAAGIGPIGLLCIRKTLVYGKLSGFISGMGAATADAVYGFIAVFGLTAITNVLLAQKFYLNMIGGLFLCYLGVKAFFVKQVNPANAIVDVSGGSLIGDYVTTFLLTIINPMTILVFMALFAGFGLANSATNYASTTIFVFGVFAGSGLWWLILSLCVGAFREKITTKWLLVLNKISGLIIFGFGLYALAALIKWGC